MGTNYFLVKTKPTCRAPLHIGKSSIGWRFLFYRPDRWETDDIPLNTFEQWKEYIYNCVTSGTHVVIDEYDEVIDPVELFDMIARKQKEKSDNMFCNCENFNSDLSKWDVSNVKKMQWMFWIT